MAEHVSDPGAPLVRLWGVFGLFVANSVAFLGLVAVCFAAAKRLSHDIDLALNACFILILATFAWEYSQAIWPHSVAALCVLSAFYLAITSYYSAAGRSVTLTAFSAGLVAGFGLGIRLDVVLIFPALVLPFLFARPWRPVRPLPF